MNDTLCDFLWGVGVLCVFLVLLYAMPYILKPGMIIIGTFLAISFLIFVGHAVRKLR